MTGAQPHELTFAELRLANMVNVNAGTSRVQAPRVRVTANDYAYDGWLVAIFQKQNNVAWRCVVEDVNKRLFIHNMNQLEPARNDLAQALARMVIGIDKLAASQNIDLATTIRDIFEPGQQE